VAEYLPSKHDTLSSNPSAIKRKKKKKRKEKHSVETVPKQSDQWRLPTQEWD
jgi:hypothetical protein